VIISNQGIKPAALTTWKEKIPLIAEAVSHLDFCPQGQKFISLTT
jgi:bifunctional polynucleotide phosphatase/kinase